MKKGILLVVFIIIFSVSLVSGKIIFEGDFEEVYNIEDSIFVNFSIEKQTSASGYIETFLDCKERLLVHKKYYKINSNKKQYLYFEFPASLVGRCNLEVIFDNEAGTSEEFQISNRILVDYDLNNKFFFPLEKVIMNGTALKKNGETLEGIVIISIPELINKTVEVKDGKFFLSFEIKKDDAPGKYSLHIEAIEKNPDEEIINYGETEGEIEVKKKSTYIEIEVNESVKPPANVLIRINLLDQAKNLIENETIIFKLFSPDDIVLEESLGSNSSSSYFFKDNATRGGWNINAYYGNLHAIKPIYVEDNRKLDVDVVNSSDGSYIEIRNIGNIGYDGVIKVLVENDSYNEEIVINVNLSLGKEKNHSLDFKGDYNIVIDGEGFGEIYLTGPTGAAVAPEMQISLRSYLFFFILVFCLVAFYLLVKKKGRVFKIREKIKSRQFQSSEKMAYMVFFKFDEYFEEVERITKKYNLSLTKVNDSLYFILFYSYPEKNPEIKIFNLVRSIKERARIKNIKVSTVMNSKKFEQTLGFLKNFALTTRKMVNLADGNILIADNIFGKLQVSRVGKPRVFKIGDEIIKMHTF